MIYKKGLCQALFSFTTSHHKITISIENIIFLVLWLGFFGIIILIINLEGGL